MVYTNTRILFMLAARSKASETVLHVKATSKCFLDITGHVFIFLKISIMYLEVSNIELSLCKTHKQSKIFGLRRKIAVKCLR